IDKELYAGGRSGVLGVKLNKDGEISSKKVISSEEFEDFRRSFSAALKAVCEDLRSGNIAADPKNDACRYCEYRSVCAYDKAFK
ncbi:MAG: PD-(D/E)XK nuclease family protein, partial [Firmicutes bacterium]|nr:PD-(D/E)XK nuclease family protein [Bacillota bacterium]